MACILVVDDDPDFVEFARLILESECEIITAANGKQGLERMRETKPDLVLLDVMMSYVMDGVDVAETMRLDPELAEIPIIMCSALPSNRTSAYTETFPTDNYIAVNEWLSKPVKPNDLMVTVMKYLKQT